jgi:hypothetical protein
MVGFKIGQNFVDHFREGEELEAEGAFLGGEGEGVGGRDGVVQGGNWDGIFGSTGQN